MTRKQVEALDDGLAEIMAQAQQEHDAAEPGPTYSQHIAARDAYRLAWQVMTRNVKRALAGG